MINLPIDIINTFFDTKLDFGSFKQQQFATYSGVKNHSNHSFSLIDYHPANQSKSIISSNFNNSQTLALSNYTNINYNTYESVNNHGLYSFSTGKDNNIKNSSSITFYVSSSVENTNLTQISDNSKIKSIKDAVGSKPVTVTWNTASGMFSRLNIFKKNKAAEVIIQSPPGVYEPKGLIGAAARVMRRRVLNILDRSPTNWANALSRDDDTYNMNTAIYVSRPFSRGINSTSFPITITDASYDYPPNSGRLSNAFRKVKRTLKDILPFRKGFDPDAPENKLSVFDKMNRKERRTLIIPSKAGNRKRNGLTAIRQIITNKTSNLFSFLTNQNGDDSKDDDILGIKLLGPMFENNIIEEVIPVEELENNNNRSFFKPFTNFIQQVGSVLINVNNYKNEEENKNKDKAVNMLMTQQEKVNMIYSNGKELTTSTLSNLVQAGREIIDDTKIKAIESVSRVLMDRSDVEDEKKNEPKPGFSFKLPWDVYYRAEIPFFENSNAAVESEVIKPVTDVIKQFVHNKTVGLSLANQIVETKPNNNNVKEMLNKKSIALSILGKFFPISSFIISKLTNRRLAQPNDKTGLESQYIDFTG